MKLTFNKILNSRFGITLSSKNVINTCAVIKSRSSIKTANKCLNVRKWVKMEKSSKDDPFLSPAIL